LRRRPGKTFVLARGLRIEWQLEKPFPDFSGFVLRARQDEVPLDRDDGIELFRWTPEPGGADKSQHKFSIDLAPVREQRWASFYCKAFVIDAA
jgi:hypothetical protein